MPGRLRRGGDDIGHPGTGTMSRGEIALGLELRIGLDHGPARNAEVAREGSSGRQPLSSCESLLADRGPQRGLERGAPRPTRSEDELQPGRQSGPRIPPRIGMDHRPRSLAHASRRSLGFTTGDEIRRRDRLGLNSPVRPRRSVNRRLETPHCRVSRSSRDLKDRGACQAGVRTRRTGACSRQASASTAAGVIIAELGDCLRAL
jgi:hypothetical protein